MQLYLVYKFEDNVEVLEKYTIEGVAIKGIDKHALKYIESQVGKRNSLNCVQYNNTIEDINNDSELKEGYYLIKDQGKIVVTYKKKDIIHDKIQEKTYVPTCVVEIVPEEVELTVVEKVNKKVSVPSSSFVGYYVGYSEEVDKEVEEKVNKKFTLYVEKESIINKEEISYSYKKRKVYSTSVVCEFGMIVIDLDDVPISNINVSTNAIIPDDRIMVEKKKIKEIQSNYMSELVSLLQNGSILHTLKKVSVNKE